MCFVAVVAVGQTAVLQGPGWWKAYQNYTKYRTVMIALEQRLADDPTSWTTLEDALKAIRAQTVSIEFPDGILIYVNPAGLSAAGVTIESALNSERLRGAKTVRGALELLTSSLGLRFEVGR